MNASLPLFLLQVSCEGLCPPPRHHHAISIYGDMLHLFGGLDELGAASTRLFRLPLSRSMLDVGPGVVSIKGDWSEVESELPYNKARSAVLHKESLGLFQLGSVTLGRVNDEEAEKGAQVRHTANILWGFVSKFDCVGVGG